MFDSQKLNFQNFVTGYKHGVYVITKSACGVCEDYKADIQHINNHYLYFVEAPTRVEQTIAQKMHDRLGFPMTAAWKDNQLVHVELGERFGEDFNWFMEFLKQFGEAPLSKEELQERIAKFNARCNLSFYIFPDNLNQEERNKYIASAYDRHELPIDIDTVCPMLEIDKRVNMIMSYNATANYILYGPNMEFGPMKAALLADFFKMNNHPVEVRNLDA